MSFSNSAVETVFRYSRGIPRMINVICDRTLLIAFTESTKKINPQIVKTAVQDIGSLEPIESWSSKFWKLAIPSAIAAGIGFLALNFLVLPDFNNKSQRQNMVTLIQPEPIGLSSPEKFINYSASSQQITPGALFNASEKMPEPAAAVPEPLTLKAPDQGALKMVDPEKLVTYLSSLTLIESKLEAVKWILEAWNIDPEKLQAKEDFERMAQNYNLLQYEMNGTMKRLQTLNYPALLEIALPNAQGTKYLALSSIKGEVGIFGSVDKIEMPLSMINSLWTRKAIVLWKDFENLPESLEFGFKGKEAIWLQKNLRLLGFFQGREAPLYGHKTIQAVRELQRNNDIKDDGKFQTDSKMLVYNLLQIYSTPDLVIR